MTDKEIEVINQRYEDFCKNDGKKQYHLPFIIWLKQVARINPSEYYDEENAEM